MVPSPTADGSHSPQLVESTWAASWFTIADHVAYAPVALLGPS